MQRLNGGRSKILETRTGLLTTAPARILIPMWGGAISPSGDMPKNRVQFIRAQHVYHSARFSRQTTTKINLYPGCPRACNISRGLAIG